MTTEGPLRMKPIIYKVTDPSNSAETVQKIYDQWAKDYDKDILDPREAYKAPEMVATQFEKAFKNKDAKILDIGAGTGLLGKMLKERGFTNMDALDPNDNMLKEARKLNVYNNFIVDFVGKNKLDIADDTYDAVVGCGIYVPGHANWESFEELCRITKPGGTILIMSGVRYNGEENHFYAEKMQEGIKELEKKGKWARKSHEYHPYHTNNDASVSILHVL